MTRIKSCDTSDPAIGETQYSNHKARQDHGFLVGFCLSELYYGYYNPEDLAIGCGSNSLAELLHHERNGCVYLE